MSNSAKNFEGRKALIIGGTGGIGRAIAITLANEGARVIIHGGSSAERLEKTINDLQNAGDKNAGGFLHKIEGSQDAERILAKSPDPDILICAWGPFERASLENTDAELWERMTLFNLSFPGTLVSQVLPGMIERNYGRILLFGGTNTDTIRGFSTTAAYSAAKTALGVLAKSAAKACSGKNVSCNVICPGLTNTEYLGEEERTYNKERSPGNKPIETSDIARFALSVLENPCLNGSIIPFDKGIAL